MSLFPKFTPAKPAKAAKVDPALASLATLAEVTANPIVSPLPKWQEDLCCLHSRFMETTGNCTRTIEDCFISRLIKCNGDLHQLSGYEIGQGITCGEVLNCCHGEEDKADLKKRPVDFIFIAESIQRGW